MQCNYGCLGFPMLTQVKLQKHAVFLDLASMVAWNTSEILWRFGRKQVWSWIFLVWTGKEPMLPWKFWWKVQKQMISAVGLEFLLSYLSSAEKLKQKVILFFKFQNLGGIVVCESLRWLYWPVPNVTTLCFHSFVGGFPFMKWQQDGQNSVDDKQAQYNKQTWYQPFWHIGSFTFDFTIWFLSGCIFHLAGVALW